ncbi:DNA cytosine methyltransferase [Listeria sp. FSL L7-1582]|uniref:DNA cytosine methyltransferase n=1 Tax=Listeria portnoyi TaxID=2713504 RepID=UPI00164E8E54|nr:DNA cytosine methyltransferase [Listeria portnoyi]
MARKWKPKKQRFGLIVDNFAGGGGTSTGIEQAIGEPVDIAINHDSEAIRMHEVNHPETKHYCESVYDIDPKKVTKGRSVDLCWLSPDCKHFSKAKGGRPVDKSIRGLAWVAIRWAATVKPRVIMLENVEEFKGWGPVMQNEKGDFVPDPEKKGSLFNSFVNILSQGVTKDDEGLAECLETLEVSPESLQARKIMQGLGYVVETKELVACDYGAPTKRKRLFLIARRDGQEIVWPTPTHGNPKLDDVQRGELKPWRTASEIIDWTDLGKSIFDRKKPLAENTLRRIARGIRKFVIENPKPYILDDSVAPTLMVNTTGHPGTAVDEPISTITTGGHHALISPLITRIGQTGFGKDKLSYSMLSPLTTITTKAEHLLISPILVQMGYGDSEGKRQISLHNPLGTITSGGNKFGMAAAFLVKHYGGNYNGPGTSMKEPLHTITSVDHNAVCTAFIARQFGTRTGHKVDEPLKTIMPEGGGKSQLVSAFLMKYYGSDTGQGVDEPIHTIVGKDRFGLVTIKGEQYRITDIHMRMLQSRELYPGQGFPEQYIFDRDINGKYITKKQQIAKCGNAVVPQLAKALVEANLPDRCRGNMTVQDSLPLGEVSHIST